MLMSVPVADQRTEVGNDGRAPIADAYVRAKVALDALLAALAADQQQPAWEILPLTGGNALPDGEHARDACRERHRI
jgi:hypothetical protein